FGISLAFHRVLPLALSLLLVPTRNLSNLLGTPVFLSCFILTLLIHSLTTFLDRLLEKYGVAQVAQLKYCPVGWDRDYRYVVKRNLEEKKTGELYFRYHILVTNNETDCKSSVLEWHLQHANMENRIKEHKRGFALEKL